MNQNFSRFINRELSWLEFNQRVLDEARDPKIPLLERLKFLAITGSNLDEFFMVRVGGLQMLSEQGNARPDPAGMSADRQLEAISRRIHRMTADQYECYVEELEPGLAQGGLRRVKSNELTDRQSTVLQQVFEEEIWPVLTPMAIRESKEFPLLINQTMNVGVQLKPNEESEGQPRFAVIPLGRTTNRFITVPSDGDNSYVLLEDVVARHIDRFFPGEEVVECVPFRLTRNADFSLRDDLAADLLSGMEDILAARKKGECVRLEIAANVSNATLEFLQRTLEVAGDDVYLLPGPLDLASFMRLTEAQGFDSLRYEQWPPRQSPQVDPTESIFETITRGDVLLYHPFHSFEPVQRFIETAAADPDVLAIKQTLYRTSRNSPIVTALRRAAERGKYVTAIVELKARFDEARNMEWARSLEQAGVQVIYGVKGLKTHAKVCIVVRREPHGIQRYVHFGTGNYNEQTARLYTDASLLTANEDLGADATAFFNAVTGYSQPQKFRKIDIAPLGLRERILELIEGETQRKRHGQKARIMAKLNSLADPEVIDALYAASQAGVKISLNVRGICCLRPGVQGLSENITVVSIVDRFLEHSRILYFYHGGDERVYISSADWMPRNLDRRVELLVPVEDAAARDRLLGVLDLCLNDTVKGRRLQPDGSYKRVTSKKKSAIRSQEQLFQLAGEAVKRAVQSRRTTLEPHRPDGDEE
ncbi:MAG: polyphosphate kinase 1 [Planctomycetaceae bacterium]|nr:polyphosphate kinase 1 [Planctomycetaceae bacterium]